MVGLIECIDLLDLPLKDAITAILNVPRLRFGDLKLADLLLRGSVSDLRLADYNSSCNYGAGVYVFFDGDVPVYVGMADNFLHRFLSHRSTEPRLGWGWNALLQKVCVARLGISSNHSREHLENALSIIDDFCVVRILLRVENQKIKLPRLERVIMKGIKLQFDTLLNSKIGKINDTLQLKNLL